MKSFTRALALGLTLGFAPLALAGGDAPEAVQGPVQLIDDEEDAALDAIEKQLNEILLVDEAGVIVLRDATTRATSASATAK
jgi:hypothetical protein